jgi:hypothetical protein
MYEVECDAEVIVVVVVVVRCEHAMSMRWRETAKAVHRTALPFDLHPQLEDILSNRPSVESLVNGAMYLCRSSPRLLILFHEAWVHATLLPSPMSPPGSLVRIFFVRVNACTRYSCFTPANFSQLQTSHTS